jgi:hypothetical protein
VEFVNSYHQWLKLNSNYRKNFSLPLIILGKYLKFPFNKKFHNVFPFVEIDFLKTIYATRKKRVDWQSPFHAVCKKKRRNRAHVLCRAAICSMMQPWRDFGGPSLGGVLLARSLAWMARAIAGVRSGRVAPEMNPSAIQRGGETTNGRRQKPAADRTRN